MPIPLRETETHFSGGTFDSAVVFVEWPVFGCQRVGPQATVCVFALSQINKVFSGEAVRR